MTERLEQAATLANEPETVTIAKMTEEEANLWLIKNYYAAGGMNLLLLKDLGLIKPEPTREERFWEDIDYLKSAFGDEIVDIVKKALEFER